MSSSSANELLQQLKMMEASPSEEYSDTDNDNDTGINTETDEDNGTDAETEDGLLPNPVDRLRRWRQAALVLNSSRLFRYTLDLKKEEERDQIRRKIRAHAQAIRAALLHKEASEKINLDERTQPLLDPNETQNSIDTDDEEDRSTADGDARDHDGGGIQEYGATNENNDNTHNRESLQIESRVIAGGRETQNENHDWRYLKVLEWIFLIFNFIVEVPALVFDQLSSVHKPQYAQDAMLISIAAFIMCIVEFAYKAWNRCRLRRCCDLESGSQGSESHKLLATFIDIIGPICASGQLIVTIINYILIHKHDNPIKISVWPVLFAFGLLCSKLLDQICGRTNSQL